jgi:hypothetical protein
MLLANDCLAKPQFHHSARPEADLQSYSRRVRLHVWVSRRVCWQRLHRLLDLEQRWERRQVHVESAQHAKWKARVRHPNVKQKRHRSQTHLLALYNWGIKTTSACETESPMLNLPAVSFASASKPAQWHEQSSHTSSI